MTNTTNFSNLFDLCNNTVSSDLFDLITMLEQNPTVLPNPETGYLLLCDDVMSPDSATLFETCANHSDLVRENVDLALNSLNTSDVDLLCKIYGLHDGARVPFKGIKPEISESETEAWITAIRRLRHPKYRRYFTKIAA